MQFKQGLIVTTLLELSYAQLIRSRQADDRREEMVIGQWRHFANDSVLETFKTFSLFFVIKHFHNHN